MDVEWRLTNAPNATWHSSDLNYSVTCRPYSMLSNDQTFAKAIPFLDVSVSSDAISILRAFCVSS
jgi:hypothetical protein